MGFKSKNVTWKEVAAVGSSSMLPAGGYVAIITDVDDVESGEYLLFTYDIAEGGQKGFFETDDRVYTHQFKRWYTEKSTGFMKKFLECVEGSNPDFKLEGWGNDPNDMKGKLVGIIVQREDYTNRSGEDRARMNVEGFATADDIRNGRFKLPEPKDNRENRDSQPDAQSGVYDADIPF
jgi:hypothetical protein